MHSFWNASDRSCGWVGAPVGPRENMAVEIVAVELGVLVGALLLPAVEDFDGAWVEVDGPSGGAGFASCLVEFVADRDE